jgi:hypothetical protein
LAILNRSLVVVDGLKGSEKIKNTFFTGSTASILRVIICFKD